jgi:hypothetical protein
MKKLFTFFCLLIAGSSFSQSQITWNMGMNIAAGNYGNMHPRIVTDASGNPLVIWNHNSNVMFTKWTGTSFTTPVALNQASMPVAGASWMGPDIASNGDTVYVIFKMTPETDTASHIYIERSFDAGLTFSMPFQVDHIADSLSRFPTITIDGSGNPVVAFMKFDANFMDSRWVVTRSDDFGNTFSADTKVSGWNGSSAVCDCCPGSIMASRNFAAMLYRDNNNNIRDMWAAVSNDSGRTFMTGMPVDQNNWQVFSCSASGPDGVTAGDSLYTVYMSSASGSARVYLSSSSLSSLTGGTGFQITGTLPGLTTQNYPRIATDGTAMGIVWPQTINGTDQAALLFTSDIAMGFPAGYDTVDLDNVTNADAAISNGNIYVVWEDDASGTVKFRSGTFNSVTAVGETLRTTLQIFPSLTNDLITVNTNGENAELIMTDVVGHVIMNRKVNERSAKVSLKQFENGVYFVTLISQSNKIITNKIVKYE